MQLWEVTKVVSVTTEAKDDYKKRIFVEVITPTANTPALSPGDTLRLVDRFKPRACPLTSRQLEGVALLSAGLTYKEIAVGWDVSVSTVRTHLSIAYQRLGITTGKTGAVLLAREEGWI